MRNITANIDNKERAVLIDGRLFYDLDHLIEQFRPTIDIHKIAAKAMGDEETIAYVEGQDYVIEAIEESAKNLMLEHDMGVE